MFIGASIIILGTCVQAPSTSLPMFIGGRFVLGFGVATCATAGPSYVGFLTELRKKLILIIGGCRNGTPSMERYLDWSLQYLLVCRRSM